MPVLFFLFILYPRQLPRCSGYGLAILQLVMIEWNRECLYREAKMLYEHFAWFFIQNFIYNSTLILKIKLILSNPGNSFCSIFCWLLRTSILVMSTGYSFLNKWWLKKECFSACHMLPIVPSHHPSETSVQWQLLAKPLLASPKCLCRWGFRKKIMCPLRTLVAGRSLIQEWGLGALQEMFYSCVAHKRQTSFVGFENAQRMATGQSGSFYLELFGSLVMLRLLYQNLSKAVFCCC